MDDLQALEKGLCTQNEKKKCIKEFGTKNLEWACANCSRKKPEDLSSYTIKLLNMRRLQQAGYPLKANDLTLEEWFDLGVVNQFFADKDKQEGLKILCQILRL